MFLELQENQEKKQILFGYNRATQGLKQAGSAIKPLAILAPGISNGIITAATIFNDVPTKFGKYQPKNYDRYIQRFDDYERSYCAF